MKQPLQTVLIVDDEPRNLRIMQESLADDTLVRTATNGAEALTVADQILPDLVFLDIMMPGLDGYEVCKKLRKNPKLIYTKIVLVSGKAHIEERLKGYAAGADDYVTKPFVPDELLAKAKVFLRLVAAERGLHLMNQDLEEKVRIRSEQLIRIEQAAFIGIHAAEIVHNLSNPLAIVMGNIELLKRIYPDEKRVGKLSSAVNNMQVVIRSILQVGKQEHKRTENLDINTLLRDELKLLESEQFLKYQVTTTLDLKELPPIKGQASHFLQSFGNLIKNAIESMYESERRELKISTGCQGGFIQVEIADTGSGIATDDLEKVFDPFFTTKPFEAKGDEPTGTGLGLPSVKRMLAAYQASIEFDSTVGEGTTVRVKIPMLRAGEAALSRQHP